MAFYKLLLIITTCNQRAIARADTLAAIALCPSALACPTHLHVRHTVSVLRQTYVLALVATLASLVSMPFVMERMPQTLKSARAMAIACHLKIAPVLVVILTAPVNCQFALV